ncbi:alpha/beta hydrolase [Pelagerythrobacter sp.]|uniref:alpha/beta hydrolase n=1 Tax=Pelagerythrobacter sp. TaxID=2800702 RepID=UPI0035AEF6E9
MSDTAFHEMADGRRIAFRLFRGTSPALVFLPGYMSDMAGSKAGALLEWARGAGRACVLLDYSGCGESAGQGTGGDFADGTLTRWREEVLELIDAQVRGPVVLVGSSMGGWLMLLVGEALGERLAGMIGVAAAPDFSDWGFDEAQKAELRAGHTVLEDNPYGPEPTPTHAKFWQDAETLRLLERPIAIDCPVRLLHGQADADVPWEVSLRTAAALRSADVQVVLVKDGDHRLSRAQDIALLLHAVDTLPT